jgi:hypothetical protein
LRWRACSEDGVVAVIVWHGDQVLMQELLLAIDRNCSCQGNNVCAAHRAMTDQRWLDTILFMRWLVQQDLLGEEVPPTRVRSGR